MLSLHQHLEKYQNSSKYIFDGRPIIKQVHENVLKLGFWAALLVPFARKFPGSLVRLCFSPHLLWK